jgi:3-phosphoshikimate 1-carboxyvinyltransferase
MILTVYPGGPLLGEVGDQASGEAVSLPGDKSISHRAALFAAMAHGESRIRNFMVSGVTGVLLEALSTLGVKWRLDGTTLTVQGRGLEAWRAPEQPLHCGNSATTLRLLAGALAAAGLPAVLDGSPGLRARPMGRILKPLRLMGVPIRAAQGDCAPLTIEKRSTGTRLSAIDYHLPVPSAQVKTCLMLAALAGESATILHESAPTRDHSERMLAQMGAEIRAEQAGDATASMNTITIQPLNGRDLRPLDLAIPGDFSSAAFLIVAALITPGSRLELRGVGLNPTRTGLLDALAQMGAQITLANRSTQGGEPTGDLLVGHSPLHGTEIGGELVVRMIDEAPAFTVACLAAQGTSRIRDAQELRYKESDRLAALCRELARLAARVTEQPDGMSIEGGQLVGGDCESHGDHRLAMSLAVAGLAAARPVTVHGAGIIAESYPAFTRTLASLGARLSTGEQESA